MRLLTCDMHQIHDPAAYALQILRNLVRDKIRELQKAQRVLEVLATSAARNGTSRDGQGEFEDGELLRHLLQRTELTRSQQEIVRLFYFDGLSISDISRRLSKNPGTIHRHHHRAIEKLSAYASRLELEHDCTG